MEHLLHFWNIGIGNRMGALLPNGIGPSHHTMLLYAGIFNGLLDGVETVRVRGTNVLFVQNGTGPDDPTDSVIPGARTLERMVANDPRVAAVLTRVETADGDDVTYALRVPAGLCREDLDRLKTAMSDAFVGVTIKSQSEGRMIARAALTSFDRSLLPSGA